MKVQYFFGHRLALLLSLAAVLLSAGTITAQDQGFEERSQLLVGTWELDLNKTLSSLKSSGRAYYDNLKEHKKSAIRDSFGTRRVTFGSDGSYTISSGKGQMSGTWELYGDGETLAIFPGDGRAALEQRLIDIGQSKLELGLHPAAPDNQLFDVWHMKRITNRK